MDASGLGVSEAARAKRDKHASRPHPSDVPASPAPERDELAEIVERYGDDRRTRILPYDGDVAMEDLIPEEDVVVTITRGGYVKRTREDQYRSQKRGGKGDSSAGGTGSGAGGASGGGEEEGSGASNVEEGAEEEEE